MLLAMLMIGVGTGLFGAIFALTAGASLLTCVAIYAGAGMISILFAALLVFIRSERRDTQVPSIAIPAE